MGQKLNKKKKSPENIQNTKLYLSTLKHKILPPTIAPTLVPLQRPEKYILALQSEAAHMKMRGKKK